MASVVVRLAAVKAVSHIREQQTLSRPSLIPFLVAMKVAATDEDEKVRHNITTTGCVAKSRFGKYLAKRRTLSAKTRWYCAGSK